MCSSVVQGAMTAPPDVQQIHLSMDNSYGSNEGAHVMITWYVHTHPVPSDHLVVPAIAPSQLDESSVARQDRDTAILCCCAKTP